MLVLVLGTIAATMNGGGIPYTISNPNGPGYRTDFSAKPTFAEYFDVYGKVETKYSQVYWTRNAPYDLPKELVERFKDKVIAITGYEIDQVMSDDPTAKLNADTSADRSVPIYNAYNHHYFAWLTGADSEVVDLDAPNLVPNPTWTAVRTRQARLGKSGYPSSIVMKENPGGEFRKSYHGYPEGYAQLLYSPTHWVVEPMQIDTHNRAYNATDDTVGYKRWLLPKGDDMATGYNDPHSHLSPLIECPCSDRIGKTATSQAAIQVDGSCGEKSIANEDDCRDAVAAIATVSSVQSISNASFPPGCILAPAATEPQSYTAMFNTIAAAAPEAACDGGAGNSSAFTWSPEQKASKIDCGDGGCLPPSDKYGCNPCPGGSSVRCTQCAWSSVDEARGNCSNYAECKGFYCSSHYDKGEMLCFGRRSTNVQPSSNSDDVVFTKQSQLPLAGSSATVPGALPLVNASVSHDGIKATITLSGPSGVWFGVGFNAAKMADAPYALIVDGAGKVTERRLVDHGPGVLLNASVRVESSTTAGGVRTVVLSRSVAGATKDHYSLPTEPGQVNLITATGVGAELAYHKARTGATLTLLPTDSSACVCTPERTQTLTYMNTTSMKFNVDCEPEPRGDMKKQHNPACDLMTYHGGLRCCKHTWFLTDREQAPVVENTTTDTYYLKFRYYFQEYSPPKADAQPPVPASHKHLHHWVFLIDANVNDYEEVQCDPHNNTGCVGKITAHVTAATMGLEDTPATYDKVVPLVMTPHCHAPSCIREELWNADTNEIICGVSAQYGKGINVFNESDYVAIPPCIWGNETGLQAPPTLKPATKIRAVKYFNNSWRHLGQMAQWTGLMVYDTDPFQAELGRFS